MSMVSLDATDGLKSLLRKMADLTAPKCAGTGGVGSCNPPHSCCSPEYCEMTLGYAKESWGVELQRTEHPRLPLMGPLGCIAEPHLRPLCTLHLCKINGLGCTGDKKFDKAYFKLRDEINTALYLRDAAVEAKTKKE